MYKSNCKNCDHNIHTNGLCPVAFMDYNEPEAKPIYCECDEYIPSENLEFLEYKYIHRRTKV